MLSILYLTVSGLTIFMLGYYFGHQYGSTQHIREQLERARSNKNL